MRTVKKDELQAFFGSLPWGTCPFSAVRENLLDVRSKNRLPEQAETVLTVLFPYLLEEKYYTDDRLSRYAFPADYHAICGDILEKICRDLTAAFPENRFVFFVDSSPVPEVQTACLSGLGVKGKNGLLIHKDYGSWVFIGEIVTDLVVECEPATVQSCMGCDACLQACPTGALNENGHDANKCLSYISQKKKLTADDEILLKKHNCLWGCDRCQTACPLNNDASPTFMERFRATAQTLLTRNDPERVYAWRGEAIFRNLELLEE